nr:hypothetical protein [Tanacetum cinerariifolium]
MGYYFYFPPENKFVVARYAEFLEKNLLSQEISGSAEELEKIQDEDTSPSENTSEIPLEVQGFEPPQEGVVPIRRSARTHRAPDSLCLNVKVEEHSLGDLNEHTNYKAAILDPESDKAIRILIAIVAFYDYEIWKMDVKTAFLNGYLDKDIYIWCNLKVLLILIIPDKMNNSKRGYIPVQEKLDLNKTQGASTPEEVKRMQNVPYALAVGSIMYAVRCTRLDVAFAQNITSRFQQNPGERHWTAMKTILKLPLRFRWRGSRLEELEQSTNTMSATESEHIFALEPGMEAVWIRKFILGLGIVPTINEPIKMFCENSAALHFANEPVVQKIPLCSRVY